MKTELFVFAVITKIYFLMEHSLVVKTLCFLKSDTYEIEICLTWLWGTHNSDFLPKKWNIFTERSETMGVNVGRKGWREDGRNPSCLEWRQTHSTHGYLLNEWKNAWMNEWMSEYKNSKPPLPTQNKLLSIIF